MKSLKYFIAIACFGSSLSSNCQVPFTSGNIVVYRVGDGSALLNANASKVFLDEYTPLGILIQSIQMPVTGQKLTAVGNESNAGLLTLSANRRYLVIPGYNADPGTNPLPGNGTIGRSIGLIDFDGTVNNVTGVPNTSTFPIKSATSDNGTNLWYSGADGIEYTTTGSSSPIKILNYNGSAFTTGLSITDGKLYVGHTTATGNIKQVGNGLPTTLGQTTLVLPGIDVGQVHFAFADMDPGIPGADVLYVCALAGSTNGGLRKYSKDNNGNWIFNVAVGTQLDRFSGLTLKVLGNSVTLFTTRLGSNNPTVRGGELVAITDNSGYNGGVIGAPTTIASAVNPLDPLTLNKKAFRGVSLVPFACLSPIGLTITNISSTQVNFSWGADPGAEFEYVVTTNPGPISGTNTTSNSASVNGLTNNQAYYIHVRKKCGAGRFSDWATISFFTGCQKVPTPISIITSSIGTATIHWKSVFGASGYQYVLSTIATPPLLGTATPDTLVTITGLIPFTQYYFHVRSDCGAGSLSGWSTQSFTTGCFSPSLNINISGNNAVASWNKVPGIIKYEFALTTNPANPLSGKYTTDTFYLISDRRDGSSNYFHIRSFCSNGATSEWYTTNFSIKGMQVYPNPITESLNINLYDLNNNSGKIHICDAMGRLIKLEYFSGTSKQIDTRTWAPGVYFIHYSNGKEKYTVKAVKY